MERTLSPAYLISLIARGELELHEPNSSSPLVITSSRGQWNAASDPAGPGPIKPPVMRDPVSQVDLCKLGRVAYLPEDLEVFLLDAQQLAVFSSDDRRMARTVVEYRLAESGAHSQRAQRHRVL